MGAHRGAARRLSGEQCLVARRVGECVEWREPEVVDVQATAWPQHACQLRNRGFGIVPVMHAETGDDQVERLVGERQIGEEAAVAVA